MIYLRNVKKYKGNLFVIRKKMCNFALKCRILTIAKCNASPGEAPGRLDCVWNVKRFHYK